MKRHALTSQQSQELLPAANRQQPILSRYNFSRVLPNSTLPANLLRIGDFSQLAQVSVPTLRHYNDLGLLPPAHVDPFTDYRYYALDQLPRLNRILALKDLGLSLDQIKRLIHEQLPAGQLRSMLATKRADIEHELSRERDRLARVEARLRQIEEENAPPRYEVVLKRVEAQTIVATRQIVPHIGEMGDRRWPMFEGFYAALQARGVSVQDIDLELVLYHNPEFIEENIDMEVAGSINRAAQKKLTAVSSPLIVRELPAVATMASTVHSGSLYDIPQAIIALYAWLGANGYRSAGHLRECHLFGSEVNVQTPEEACLPHILEMQIPVARATEP